MELKIYDQAVLDYNRALEIRPGAREAVDGLMEAGEQMRENP